MSPATRAAPTPAAAASLSLRRAAGLVMSTAWTASWQSCAAAAAAPSASAPRPMAYVTKLDVRPVPPRVWGTGPSRASGRRRAESRGAAGGLASH